MSAPPERELTRSERAAIRRLVTSLCANYDCQDKLCLRRVLPLFPGGGAAYGAKAGICPDR